MDVHQECSARAIAHQGGHAGGLNRTRESKPESLQ